MTETAPATFFRSRWVERPATFTELEPDSAAEGLPRRRRSGRHQAPRARRGPLVSDEPETVSAARFGANALVGAPVAVSAEARLDGLRAVLASSGNANVSDGERGLETARASQALAAELLGVEPDRVGLASTGVIGRELPRDRLLEGARAAAAALGPDTDDFTAAMLTTDRWPKRACLEVELPSGHRSACGPGEGRRA